MLNNNSIADQNVRKQALNAKKSFIVQAPAGSGKTTLLVQRFLTLLSYANEPEECLAITFTCKAAAEMRERILNQLLQASQEGSGNRVVEKVLARDRARNWQLVDNPGRLKIQTIDALCASITQRMPILSKFGAQPKVNADPRVLYEMAVKALLTEKFLHDPYLTSLNIILEHLDNNRELVKELFMDLLPLREQWLPYIVQAKEKQNIREILESSLAHIAKELLQQLSINIPDELKSTISWPNSDLFSLPNWLELAELFLTKEGECRKTVTKDQGFIAPSASNNKQQRIELKKRKEEMLACLRILENYKEFCKDLQLLRYLQALKYTDQKWRVIEALITLLPYLVAQLLVVFREQDQVDFAEVSIAARTALGAPDLPSELALALDYKIQHILVDEFQDTSIAQFKLLEQLVSGWIPGDGRTLFLVGDPMQSIYRFRQAEVGLFITAKEHGIGNVKLDYLQLTTNFRSSSKIVNWINHTFSQVFPKQNNITLGAINYTDSVSVYTEGNEEIQFYLVPDGNKDLEAKQIVDLIIFRKSKFPHETIAILVRARNHLSKLALALNQAKIPYQGVEIELLHEKPIVQDLLSLTKALLHLGDRIAWFAVLRAPWCGLKLNDFEVLFLHNHNTCVWEILKNFGEYNGLSADGINRLKKIVPILEQAIENRSKQPLNSWIFNTWQALSNLYCMYVDQNIEDMEAFFELLYIYNNDPQIFKVDFLDKKLTELFAKPKVLDTYAVQIMTIHKAKGLEFDTVILPGLGRRPITGDDRLLRWEERVDPKVNKYLLLAPIKAVGEKSDPIYKFMKVTDQARDRYELARLTYVACTRAKKALFGFGHVVKEQPQANSILDLIWDIASDSFITIDAQQKEKSKKERVLYRLPLSAMGGVVTNNEIIHKECQLNISSFNWMREVGIILHRIFWEISTYGLLKWQQTAREELKSKWQSILSYQGVPKEDLPKAMVFMEAALSNALSDPTGLWILNHKHKEAKSEWALSVVLDGKVQQIVIDRTFVDQHNIRWIIDYKFYHYKEVDNMVFKYKQQLCIYEKALKLLFPKDIISTGLYFPAQRRFLQTKRCHTME